MRFEIDVSGMDIFDENYTICISCKDNPHLIKGFKFTKELIENLKSNWENKKYRYGLSPRQRGFFKVRLYCIIIYYLFKSIKKFNVISLTICKDFHGHKNDINQNLKYFLEKRLNIKIGSPLHQRLPKNSNAHWYAYLMSKDTVNKFSMYENITLKDIEKFLKKYNKITPKGHRPKS